MEEVHQEDSTNQRVVTKASSNNSKNNKIVRMKNTKKIKINKKVGIDNRIPNMGIHLKTDNHQRYQQLV